MRLSSRIHGILDYVLAVLMIAAPWIFSFPTGVGAGAATIAAGLALAAYSIVTDYEPAAIRRLSLPGHLLLDAVVGVLLALSPWVLGFDDRVWIPHVVLGLAAVAAAAVTHTVPGYERRRAAR